MPICLNAPSPNKRLKERVFSGKKDKDLSFTKLRLQTWDKFELEVDKCILVCRNCHGEIHAGLHPEYLVVKEQD